MERWRPLAAALVVLGGCYDAGPYGYDLRYRPLDDEESFYERGEEVVYNEIRTDPADYEGRLISWFGVVQRPLEGDENPYEIPLSFRTHQERHLCSDERRESCRVTVSQSSSGTFTARVELRDEDVHGRNRIAPESLMRVYCRVTGDYDAEGGPLLECEHYRHWPRGQWAHTGMRAQMRR